jgi:hypothetical protein
VTTGAPVVTGTTSRSRSLSRRVLVAVQPVLVPWAALHLLVLIALAVVTLDVGGRLPLAGTAPGAYGWWAWDAGWYRAIAADGYAGIADADLRFFPLFPLLGRLLGGLPGVSAGAGLVLVASAAALAYLALLARLVTALTGSADTARRTTWLAALFPGAGVLVLPYTEAVAGLLAVAFFLGLQRRSVPLVVVAGALSGVARPTGMVLALAAATYLLTDRSRWAVALAGAVAPVLGTAGFCLWTLATYGDATAPYSLQSRPGLRGGVLVNPLPAVLNHPLGELTLLLMAASVALLVLVARTLPLPYTTWSAAVLVLAITSTQANSLPRYVAQIFPLLIAGAVCWPSGRGWRVLLIALAVLSGALTATWFADRAVP